MNPEVKKKYVIYQTMVCPGLEAVTALSLDVAKTTDGFSRLKEKL